MWTNYPLTPARRGEYKESDSTLSPRCMGVRGLP